MADRVLVTGATGFIAQHCIVQLLDAGYVVRGTARSAARTEEVARVIAPHVSDASRARLATDFEVVGADLESDDGWAAAVQDCRYVLHVASPFPRTPPRRDDDLIVPARDGVLRVLRAASDAHVQRVVLTSSMAAIVYGNRRHGTFDESDWSNVDGTHIGAYEKSKTIAERAAWDFVSGLPSSTPLELATINPGLVLGPLLSADWGTSGEVVKKIIDRDIPAIPALHIAVVDVRDVASAHLAAMTSPDANGLRFACAIENHSMLEIATILKTHLGPMGYKITTASLPSFAIRIVALWDKTARLALNEVGTNREIDSTRIRQVLGWTPRDLDTMTIDMADSMIAYGVVAAPTATRK